MIEFNELDDSFSIDAYLTYSVFSEPKSDLPLEPEISTAPGATQVDSLLRLRNETVCQNNILGIITPQQHAKAGFRSEVFTPTISEPYDPLFDTTTQSSGSNPTRLDSALQNHLLFFGKTNQFLAASQAHEQSGELELALEDVEQALEYLDQMAQKQVAMLNGHSGFIHKYNHFTLRKGAILLALGKKEEAVKVFLNHPPQDIATTLLYRFVEQKFHVQLLSLTDLVQDTPEQNYVERAESLFFAGHYDEAELLLNEKPYGGFLRCACLTILGRIEEARELRKKFDGDTPAHVMLYILHADLPNHAWQNIVSWQNWEWLNQFPIMTIVAYSDKF